MKNLFNKLTNRAVLLQKTIAKDQLLAIRVKTWLTTNEL